MQELDDRSSNLQNTIEMRKFRTLRTFIAVGV